MVFDVVPFLSCRTTPTRLALTHVLECLLIFSCMFLFLLGDGGEFDFFLLHSQGVSFSPKRVLILTKMTRLEFEQRTNPRLNAAQLETEVSIRMIPPLFSIPL
jgi:hypothetical protein